MYRLGKEHFESPNDATAIIQYASVVSVTDGTDKLMKIGDDAKETEIADRKTVAGIVKEMRKSDKRIKKELEKLNHG